ncbi:MAG TPA: hypothetical protein VGQ82_10730 [Chthoniobacterales bacterium]|nr:hypothetical protein [Chthoniobacterales bacterium]
MIRVPEATLPGILIENKPVMQNRRKPTAAHSSLMIVIAPGLEAKAIHRGNAIEKESRDAE